MNRVQSGIPGLDDLLEGGFPEGSTVLVSGGAGSGKSILSLQYLYFGAKELGEKGIYVTLEEGPHNLLWNMQRFKWDLLPLGQEGLLKIFKFEPEKGKLSDIDSQIDKIIDETKKLGAKRLVIDSITAFEFWVEDEGKIRYAMYTLLEELRRMKCTSLLTCETHGRKEESSRFGVEDFLVDGVMMVYFIPPHRAIFVKKMRGTDQSRKVHPFEITGKGCVVDPSQEILWSAIKD